MENNKFITSISPHTASSLTTSKVMRGVIISLLPAMLTGIYLFGLRAALLILICVVTSMGVEALYQVLRKKPVTLGDGSAFLTGLLMAMVLPPAIPFWCAIVGAVVAIVLGKHIFGGLGYNIFNPALVGRAFLMAAFPVFLTTWSAPAGVDAVTSATPLSLILPKFAVGAAKSSVSLWQMFVGSTSGSLGETSAIALLIGGLYMLWRGYACWRIPLSYTLTVVVFGGIFWILKPGYPSPIAHLLAGGFMLGVLFMATDPVTTPITKKGRYIFGIGAGVLMVIIRLWGGMPEGVMYSILLMNSITPLINRYTKPVIFGKNR